jgi:uncharacterized membrane protein YkgB
MSIKPLHIETVFSGFIHLLWSTLLTLFILGKFPSIILNFLDTIGSGTAVLLIAVAFSLSFFLGRIAEHFFIALNFCRKNKNDKEDKVKKLADNIETKGEIWGNKIFFFSTSVGLIILGFLLYILTEAWNVKLAIIVIDGMLTMTTVISTIYWYYLDNKIH